MLFHSASRELAAATRSRSGGMSKRSRSDSLSSSAEAWLNETMRERSPKRRRVEEDDEEISNIFWWVFVDIAGLFDAFLIKLLDPMSVAALACVNKHTYAGIYRVDARPRLPWPSPTCDIVADSDVRYYLLRAQRVARAKLALNYDHIGRFRTLWSPGNTGLHRRIVNHAIWASAAECMAHVILTSTASAFEKWRAIKPTLFRRAIFEHVPFAQIKHWMRIFHNGDKRSLYEFMMLLIHAPVALGRQREFFRLAHKHSIPRDAPRLSYALSQFLVEDMTQSATCHLREVLHAELTKLAAADESDLSLKSSDSDSD